MKRTCLMVLFLMVFCCGCSSGLNDSLGGGTVTGEGITGSASSDSLAGYQYLGILYDEEEGKCLNDLALQGEMHDRYRQEIQEALNVMMRYPIQESQPVLSGGDPWWEVPWYSSVPETVKRHYIDFPGEVRYRTNARGMASFLMTEEGADCLERYVAQQRASSSELIDYGLMGVLDEFQPAVVKILGSEGIIVEQRGGAGIASAFTGVCFLDPVSVAPTMMALFREGGLSSRRVGIDSRYREMQGLLVDLQRAHREVAGSLDSGLGMANMQPFSEIEDAESRLQSLYNQLDYLGEDQESRRAVIGRLLKESDEYEFLMTKSFKAMQVKAMSLEQWAECGDVVIPVTLKIDQFRYPMMLPGGWWENVLLREYRIKNPAVLTGYLLRDITLLKRLSLARLALAEEVFSGEELLRFRKQVASMDLLRVDEMKKCFNVDYLIQEEIKSLQLNNNPMIQPIDFDPNKLKNNIILNVSQINYQIIVDNKMIFNYGEYGEYQYYLFCNWIKESSYGNCTDLDDLMVHLNSSIEEYAYSHAYKNYFVTALSILADWEIRLRAHILVAEGL
ncbi:MAG: hypothetical protein JXA20_09220 [Spirochaetes bacterium]|nr:hypothetical protein [Spirochaetota bacterium]